PARSVADPDTLLRSHRELVAVAQPEPVATVLPYTTLFRSQLRLGGVKVEAAVDEALVLEVEFADPARVSPVGRQLDERATVVAADRKSTRLSSSHVSISYAVFCLKRKLGSDRPCGGRRCSS